MFSLLHSTGVYATNCPSLTAFNWLLGEWQTHDQNNHTIERWIKASDKTIEGAGQTVNNFEYLRLLEMSGEIFYLAKVTHNTLPIAFKLTHCSASDKQRRFIFENKQHDFPNVIEYQQLSDNYMTINVSGKSGKSFTIQLHRVIKSTTTLKQ